MQRNRLRLYDSSGKRVLKVAQAMAPSVFDRNLFKPGTKLHPSLFDISDFEGDRKDLKEHFEFCDPNTCALVKDVAASSRIEMKENETIVNNSLDDSAVDPDFEGILESTRIDDNQLEQLEENKDSETSVSPVNLTTTEETSVPADSPPTPPVRRRGRPKKRLHWKTREKLIREGKLSPDAVTYISIAAKKRYIGTDTKSKLKKADRRLRSRNHSVTFSEKVLFWQPSIGDKLSNDTQLEVLPLDYHRRTFKTFSNSIVNYLCKLSII